MIVGVISETIANRRGLDRTHDVGIGLLGGKAVYVKERLHRSNVRLLARILDHGIGIGTRVGFRSGIARILGIGQLRILRTISAQSDVFGVLDGILLGILQQNTCPHHRGYSVQGVGQERVLGKRLSR